MAKVIGAYSDGKMTLNDFRAELMDHNIKVDPDLDKLIRKHESGDTQSYVEFGKRIYRQLNGTEMVNRVDKINYAPPNMVSVDKVGTKHFDMQAEMKQPKTRTLDNLMKEQQERNTAGVYNPKKGSSEFAKSNNQT